MDRKVLGCIGMMQNMTRKRKRREDEEFNELLEEMKQVGDSGTYGDNNDDIEYVTTVLSNIIAVVVDTKKGAGPRKTKIDRSHQKNFWTNGYVNWDVKEFKISRKDQSRKL